MLIKDVFAGHTHVYNPIEEISEKVSKLFGNPDKMNMMKWYLWAFQVRFLALKILPENINCEEDIRTSTYCNISITTSGFSFGCLSTQVSAQGSDMTDGCGLSSRSIYSFQLYNTPALLVVLLLIPTELHFRLAGYKVSDLLVVNWIKWVEN